LKAGSRLLGLALLAVPGPLWSLPLAFEANRGQFAPEVQFATRAEGYTAFFTSSTVVFAVRSSGDPAVRLHFAGSNGPVRFEPAGVASSRVSYLRGRDRRRWLQNLPAFSRIQCRDVYPGVDVEFYGNEGRLEYDLIVRPGADASRIRLRLEGMDSARIDSGGAVLAETPAGILTHQPPLAYQEVHGRRQPVAARYVMRESGLVALELGDHDRRLELVIDPVVSFSTFLGGAGLEDARGIAVGVQGNVYVAGTTQSTDFPATAGVYQPSARAGQFPGDVFVTKLSPDGSAVEYSTYIGGARTDVATGIAVDAAGNVYVGGYTDSLDFPTTSGAFRAFPPAVGVEPDGFVLKLNPQGAALVYSTYLGGALTDRVHGIAIDHEGNAYLAGATASPNFPTTRSAFRTGPCAGFSLDGFVSKLNAAGNGLIYSTFLCGTDHEEVLGIAVDAQGGAVVAGYTFSPDFPVTAAALAGQLRGGSDVFLTKLNPDGAALAYSTRLGGTAADVATAVALDSQGRPYVAGYTRSTDFPVTAGAFQPRHADNGLFEDAFVSMFTSGGVELVRSTYLGGSQGDRANAIAVESEGVVYLTGHTSSPDFPVTPALCQTGYAGRRDAFLSRLDLTRSELRASLFLGGREDDEGRAVAPGTAGIALLAGQTRSSNFATTQGAFRSAYRRGYRGGSDAFIARVDSGATAQPPCVAIGGIVSAATFLPGPVAPGQIVSIFGAGLGPESPVVFVLDQSLVLAKELAGVRVLFDGVAAPVLAASTGQVNTIVPYAVGARQETRVRVEYQGRATTEVVLPVARSAPAIFSLNLAGSGQGAIRNQDSSVNGSGNPAARGSILQIFGTGGGETNPAGVDGRVADPVFGAFPTQVLPVSVSIGGIPAVVHYAGAAPTLVAGVIQINAQVPLETAPGSAVPIVVTVGENSSPATITAAIR
jgi:uncharacterized protein (TIGR03437 family)